MFSIISVSLVYSNQNFILLVPDSFLKDKSREEIKKLDAYGELKYQVGEDYTFSPKDKYILVFYPSCEETVIDMKISRLISIYHIE